MTHHDPSRTAGLLARLLGPADPELTCEDCFEELDRYVELELAGRDATPSCRACGRTSRAARPAARTTTASPHCWPPSHTRPTPSAVGLQPVCRCPPRPGSAPRAGGPEKLGDAVLAALLREPQRPRSIAVGEVHIDAARDQRAHGPHVRAFTGAEHDRLVQRRPAQPVDVITLDAGVEQATHDPRMASFGGADQAGAVEAVLVVDQRTVGQRQLSSRRSSPTSLVAIR